MDLEKGGGENESHDYTQVYTDYNFEHKKAAPASTKSGKAVKPKA